MKLLPIILTLFLQGCYLANGSPSEYSFWVEKYPSQNTYNCDDISYKLLDEKEKYIFNKGNEDLENIYKNKNEYVFYEKTVKKFSTYRRKCLYDSGYRFRPPLYWCLAQDGDNTKICIENMKYRN